MRGWELFGAADKMRDAMVRSPYEGLGGMAGLMHGHLPSQSDHPVRGWEWAGPPPNERSSPCQITP